MTFTRPTRIICINAQYLNLFSIIMINCVQKFVGSVTIIIRKMKLVSNTVKRVARLKKSKILLVSYISAQVIMETR